MSKSYCMNCKKEVTEEIKKCECGGRRFVYGDNIKVSENGFVCNCGSDKYKSTFHVDYKEKSVNNYVCANCKSAIGIENYRSEENMMYWQ